MHFSGSLVQPRLATIGDVLVNDSAFGRFIECGDERAVFRCFSAAGRVPFGERTQIGDDAAIAQCTARILTGAFGGGFGVGHESGFVDGQARGHTP